MTIHFEELWEKCENFQKDASTGAEVQHILDELLMKISLYRAVDSKTTDIPEEERQRVKSRTLGEILLTLTCLSLKDNINTYESLSIALQYRSVQHYNTKHST
jgi:hypothetical protein